MSSLQKDPSGNFHICFRFQGQRYKRSLGTKSPKQANAAVAKLDERIWLIRGGHLSIPEDCETGRFLVCGSPSKPAQAKSLPKKKRLALSELFDAYFVTANNGSLEQSTLGTLGVHRRHLERHLGKSRCVTSVSPQELQNYINSRSKAKGKYGRSICGSTIRKELVALRTIWNWANELEYVDSKFTLKKLC